MKRIIFIKGVNGNVVHGEFFADTLEKLGWYESYGLVQFEVVQKNIESFNCNFVCSKRPSEAAVNEFIYFCYKFFGKMNQFLLLHHC